MKKSCSNQSEMEFDCSWDETSIEGFALLQDQLNQHVNCCISGLKMEKDSQAMHGQCWRN